MYKSIGDLPSSLAALVKDPIQSSKALVIKVKLLQLSYRKVFLTKSSSGCLKSWVGSSHSIKSKIEEFVDLELCGVTFVSTIWGSSRFMVKSIA